MSLRSLFAQNLRRLSSTKKSYALVARELDINRQQFNNYVTGKNLPNDTVIDKICEYFNVDIGYMFRESDTVEELADFAALSDAHKKLFNRFLNVEKGSRTRGLANGRYYVYFAIPNDKENVACSLLAVRREAGLCVFRRITRVGSDTRRVQPKTQSIHFGIVMYRNNVLFLLGFNGLDALTPSFLAAHHVTSSKILYAGYASVYSGSEFQQVPFAITLVPKGLKTSQAVKFAKIHASNSPQIDKSVTDILRIG